MVILEGGVMVCGTASDVGKSRIVAGLCRLLVRRGVRVAPFKAQNMALNSVVTESGHEIARSQAHQASAARIAPEVEMNPVLVKPSGPRTSQLIVMGRAVGEIAAGDFGSLRGSLWGTVTAALDSLRTRHDVIVLEGAGGAAEINLLDSDLVNLPLARHASLPAILVGDIERGGVFAAIYGTVALLPDELRDHLHGFVINKFRGDPRLLTPGVAELEQRCGLPCLGVLPHLGELMIDAEDSLALEHRLGVARRGDSELLDIAVVRLPHIANFTDFDPIGREPNVVIRYVTHPNNLGNPDLLFLPGSKATVADLSWCKETGLDAAITSAWLDGSALVGICAGYQMLGTTIVDEVESRSGSTRGLGLLDCVTTFHPAKRTLQRTGRTVAGERVVGFEIRHGDPAPRTGLENWFILEQGGRSEGEGVAEPSRGIWATSLHGVFESDEFRHSFLTTVATRRNKHFAPAPRSFEEERQAEIDRFADVLEQHLEVDAVLDIIAKGASRANESGRQRRALGPGEHS